MASRSLKICSLMTVTFALASCSGEATEEAPSDNSQVESQTGDSDIELTEMTITTDEIGPVYTQDDLSIVGPESIGNIAILCQELFAPSAWKSTNLAVVDGVIYQYNTMNNTAVDHCAVQMTQGCAIGWNDGKIVKTSANAPEFRYTEIIDPETLTFQKWSPEFRDNTRKYFAGKCEVEPFTGQVKTSP